MDYQYPLNAVQAFAICLASLDGKIADTKGFEAMRDAASAAGSKVSIVSCSFWRCQSRHPLCVQLASMKK